MAAYDTLRAAIDNYIKANGNKEITGTVLNDILNAMVSALGADTRFAGVAVPSTNPGNPEGNVVYFASQAGTYSNFGGIVLPLGIHILVWNGTAWTSQTWFSVDNTPTQNSQNLATSGGILQAIVDAVGVERLRAIGVEVTSCSFDSNTKKISFFNSANTTLFQLDATAFVIDGMVSDVKIEDGNLVIQFNTDAGKQDIEIPLTDIFNPANYYTKTAIDDLLALYYTKIETDALITAINNKLADGCLYRGMAEPTTNPPTPTTKVFYIATKAGTYTNLGNIAVTEGITILKYDGSNWSKEQISYSDGVFDISAYNGTSYADLSAALGTNGANIPQNLRKGGMSVKFVQSSDNKYVQYRLKSNYFNTNTHNWEEQSDEILDIVYRIHPGQKKSNYYISLDTPPTEVEYTGYSISNDIRMKAGDTIFVTAYGNNYSVITEVVNDTYIRSLVGAIGGDQTYSYTATEDIVVRCCYNAQQGHYKEFNYITNQNKVVNILNKSNYRQIEIKAWGSDSWIGQITKVGDIAYNPDIKSLKECVLWNNSADDSEYVNVPFYDGAIYTYNNMFFVWNGSDLIHVGAIINVNEINNKLLTTYSSKADARADVPEALRKQGLIITYKLIDTYWYTEQFMESNLTTWNNSLSWYPIYGAEIETVPTKGSSKLVTSGGVSNVLTKLEDKLIKIKAWNDTSWIGLVTQVGDVAYNPSNRKLRKCVVWNIDADQSTYDDVPYYDGAIYTFAGNLYVYNGYELVEAGQQQLYENALQAIPEWESDKFYVIGNQVQHNGNYYSCLTSHKSGNTLDTDKFIEILDFVPYSNIFGQIPLASMSNEEVDEGKISYNQFNALRIKINGTYKTVPYYPNTIYTFCEDCFVWNGYELVKVNSNLNDDYLPKRVLLKRTSWIATARNFVLKEETVNGSQYLYQSNDYGKTWNNGLENTIGDIVFVHWFSDGTILICGRQNAYWTKDWESLNQSTVYDYDGNILIPEPTEWLFYCEANYNSPIININNAEVLMWGDYGSRFTVDNYTSNYTGRLWQSTDKGQTIRCLLKSGEGILSDGNAIRHFHTCIWDQYEQCFWICTGDSGNENHLIKGIYENGQLVFTILISGNNFKFGQMYVDSTFLYLIADFTTGDGNDSGIMYVKKTDVDNPNQYNYVYRDASKKPYGYLYQDVLGHKILTPDSGYPNLIYYANKGFDFKKINIVFEEELNSGTCFQYMAGPNWDGKAVLITKSRAGDAYQEFLSWKWNTPDRYMLFDAFNENGVEFITPPIQALDISK